MKLRVAMIPIVGLVGLAVWAIHALVVRSGHPGNYYRYRHSDVGFVYPTDSVVTWSAVILIEAVIAGVVVARIKHTPGACVVMALCFGAAFMAMLPLAMHAPPYYGMHLVWLLFAAGWLVVAAIATALVNLALRRRRPSVREDRVESLDERD
jgi:hypothetical protein